MDDLIILIIRAIARMLNVEEPKVPPRPSASPAKPSAILRRAQGRRPAPPPARRPVAPVTRPVVVEEQVVPGSAGSQTHVGPVAKSAFPQIPLRTLMTPSNLRRQFILTEILQPPMALREPR